MVAGSGVPSLSCAAVAAAALIRRLDVAQCPAPASASRGSEGSAQFPRHGSVGVILSSAWFEGNEISVACACMRIGRACNGPASTL